MTPPGWHGKLPSLGDFASRRLEAPFVDAWDGWLAAGLLALREANPAGWLDAYLSSPSWRFLLQPGVLPGEAGEQGYAGVLMPSVDRVGRYFPFTVVQPLGADAPWTAQQMQSLWHWLARLDELAADAMQDDWPVERLETELARMAAPDLAPPATVDSPG
ncbi:MAG: type VI secretion system-associated protein TagF, partial [Rubrivivax sp.]